MSRVSHSEFKADVDVCTLATNVLTAGHKSQIGAVGGGYTLRQERVRHAVTPNDGGCVDTYLSHHTSASAGLGTSKLRLKKIHHNGRIQPRDEFER